MRTWMRRTLLGLLGASIVFGGLAACGHRHDRHGWSELSTEERAKVRGKVLDRVAGKLQLNADQKQRLAVLADKLEAQRAAFMGQSTYPRQELRNLVAGEKFDRTKAQALVNEKTAAVQAKSPEVIAALADFYDSLSASQQAQVREMMDKRRGRWWRS
jgi:protein CpxP